MEDANFIIILVGLPASGKSTFAQVLEKILRIKFIGFKITIIDPDIIRKEVMQGKFNPDRESIVREKNLALIKEALRRGDIVISDDLNYYSSMRHDIKEIAEELNLLYFIIHIRTPLDQCLEWNQKRGSPIPDAIIVDIAEKIEFESKYSWDSPLKVFDLSQRQNLETTIKGVLDLIIAKLKAGKMIKDENPQTSELLQYNELLDALTRKMVQDFLTNPINVTKKSQILEFRREFVKNYKNKEISNEEIFKRFMEGVKNLIR